jgi:hypothetical protein
MTFGRWLKQAPYTPHCGVLARIPQASRLKELPAVEQYAAVELFRGTMVRHSMVAYRDDSPGDAQLTSFAGDAWLGYVPLRIPHPICVEERLPRGGGCVDQPDTCLRDRSCQSIQQRRGCSMRSMGVPRYHSGRSILTTKRPRPAATFFENLWWYDQVVFDAPQCHARREDA